MNYAHAQQITMYSKIYATTIVSLRADPDNGISTLFIVFVCADPDHSEQRGHADPPAADARLWRPHVVSLQGEE